MKVGEITEFDDMQDELAAMSVAEVVIQSIVDETKDPPIAWQSVVILATPDARFFTPWVLAVRPSESDARGAVVALLRGLVDARRAAQQCAPAVDGWNAVVTTQRAMPRGRRLATAARRRRFTGRGRCRPRVPWWTKRPRCRRPCPDTTRRSTHGGAPRYAATREQRRLTQAETREQGGNDALAHQSLRA